MFTGLIEEVGHVVGVRPRGNGRLLHIRCALPDLALGDSVAVDGVCLTVESLEADGFVATAGRETMERTTLRRKRASDAVHLERALRLGDRLGGHLVQGHVDGIGVLRRAEQQRESWVLHLEVPTPLTRYVAEKGSICLDGVSLTVNGISGSHVRVNVVPHTAAVTRLGALRPGAELNVEVDLLAKYTERLLELKPDQGLTEARLRALGFDVEKG